MVIHPRQDGGERILDLVDLPERERASVELGLIPTQSYVVGEQKTDIELADRIGAIDEPRVETVDHALKRLVPGRVVFTGDGAVRYAAQIEEKPPRIAIQVNDRKLISRDWAYHLENRIRDQYSLQGVPLVIDFVPRKRDRGT